MKRKNYQLITFVTKKMKILQENLKEFKKKIFWFIYSFVIYVKNNKLNLAK